MSEPETKSDGRLAELSKAKKTAVFITIAAALFLYGLSMLLCGLGVFSNAFPTCTLAGIWLPSAFFTLAFCFLASGLIGKNPVSGWIGSAFLLPGIVGFLALVSTLSYAQLYPLYIAIPSAASLVTGMIRLKFKPHLRTIIFFGGIAGIFSLQSFLKVPWFVVGPALAGFVAMSAGYVIYKVYKYRNE